MKARHLTLFGLLGLALAALTSCTDAIFATVEKATKTATNTLSLTLNIYDIAVIPPVPPGGVYSVAAGGVFNGILSGSYPGTVAWTPNINDNSRPNNPPGTACNALAYFSGTLYGGFVTSSGSTSFYQSSDGSNSFGPGHGTLITNPVVAGKQVTLLRAAGANLFVGMATPTSGGFLFELDYFDGALWHTTNLTGLPYPITGVGFDGTNYWAVSSPLALPSTSISTPAVVYSTLIPSTFSALTPSPSGSDQVSGLFANSSGYVFLATRQSGIIWTSNGSVWNTISPDHVNGNTPVSYLCVAGPVGTDGSAPNDIYVAGSDGFGYYTLSTSGGGLSRYGNTTIILYTSSVSRITVDTGGSPTYYNVLMGTNANGLWRGVFDPTTSGQLASGQSWVQE